MDKATSTTKRTSTTTAKTRGVSVKKAARGKKVPAASGAGKSRAGTKGAGKKPAATKSKAKKSKAKKSAAKKPAAKKSAAKKSAAKKPEKSAAKKSAAKTRAAKTTAAEPPASAKPPIATSADLDTRGQGRTRSHLRPGDPAPAFSLQADDGNTYSLEDLRGERFVLYFYPKDSTPGCTQEACDFRDRQAAFDDTGVRVLGVSADSLRSHGSFRAKYELHFPLLSDPDREVADAYGALGEKTMYGQTKIGIIRSTFVVGPDARIEHVFSPVRVAGHAEAVLQAVRAA